ncbi:MAG TPA: DPP IV N-terminal domain-containing protein, partial [Longimicrobiales bacterium]
MRAGRTGPSFRRAARAMAECDGLREWRGRDAARPSGARIPPLAFVVALLAAVPAVAQQPQPYRPAALTAADYARAERFMSWNTRPLVFGASVRATWLPDGDFWYGNATPRGFEFVRVDPEERRKTPAFDQAAIAAALSAALDTTIDAFHLPFSRFEYSADGESISFQLRSGNWRCRLDGGRCTAEDAGDRQALRNAVVSPDGRLAAFIRDWNLWVRDLETGEETQLTTDGVEDFGYATNNAGWVRSDRPVLLWSPDSRKIATFKHDSRGVGMMYLVHTRVGHPELEAWKYPLPGDSAIFMIHRVIIDLDRPAGSRVIRLQMPPDPHRSTICDHVYCRGTWADVEWFPDGSKLAFVSSSRDHKRATLRIADAETGAVRTVLEETVPTFFES